MQNGDEKQATVLSFKDKKVLCDHICSEHVFQDWNILQSDEFENEEHEWK